MTDFDFEVKEKKALARSAKYKVNGSRSKKCTLSTDFMSPSQIKKMNGEMISYNFNKPMSLDEFNRLPADLGKEYILQLVEKFGGNYSSLAEMFGCSRGVAFTLLSEAPYNFKFGCGDRMNREQKAKWAEFLSCEDKSKDIHPEEAAPDEIETEDCVEQEESVANPDMRMEEFTLRFSGTITAESLANALRAVLGDGLNGDIAVYFTPHRRKEEFDAEQGQ